MRRTFKKAVAGVAVAATLIAIPSAAFAANSGPATGTKDRAHETRVMEKRTADVKVDPSKDSRDPNTKDTKVLTASATSIDPISKDKSLHDPNAKDASKDQRDPSLGGDIKK
jgi:hypothetical protein